MKMTKGRRAIVALFLAVATVLGLAGPMSPAFAAGDTEDFSALEYTGTWNGTIANVERWSNVTGNTATAAVDIAAGGGTFTVNGYSGQNNGRALVEIDSASPVLADAFYDAPCCTARDWFSTPKLAEGRHVIKFTVSGEKRSAATGYSLSFIEIRTDNGTIVTLPEPPPDPEPTPTPTPTPTTEPDPTPPASSFVSGTTKPDATNTGYGIEGRTSNLTVISGDFRPASNTTYRDIDVTGRIIIGSGVSNVTIENCKVEGRTLTSGEGRIIDAGAGHNTTIRFCEIFSGPRWGGANGIGTKNFTIERSNIHHVVDGVRLNRTPTSNSDDAMFALIKDSYIHDLLMQTPDPIYSRSDKKTHSDGVQNEGSANATITGSFIDSHHSPYGDGTNFTNTTCSSPFTPVTSGGCPYPVALSGLMYNSGTTGTITNYVVDHNWFAGGEVTINHRDSCSTGCRITNNIFTDDSLQDVAIYPKTSSVVTISGNKFTDGSPAP